MHRDWTEQMGRDGWGEAWENAHTTEGPWDPDRWGAMPEPTQLHPAMPEAPSAAPEPPGRANRPEVAPETTLIVSPARRTREPAPPPEPVDRARALRTILEEQARRFSKP